MKLTTSYNKSAINEKLKRFSNVIFIVMAVATLGMICIAAAFHDYKGTTVRKQLEEVVQLNVSEFENQTMKIMCDDFTERKPEIVFGCPSLAHGMLITLDDGPTVKTNGLLSILKDRNITALFFLNPAKMHLFPKTVERMVDEGHEIGFLISDGEGNLQENLYAYKRSFENIVSSVTPKFVRLASGAVTKEFLNVTSQMGYVVVLWNAATQRIDGKDVKHDVEVTQSSLAHVPANGAILSLSENTKITNMLFQQIVQDFTKQVSDRYFRVPFITPNECFSF